MSFVFSGWQSIVYAESEKQEQQQQCSESNQDVVGKCLSRFLRSNVIKIPSHKHMLVEKRISVVFA